MDALDSRPFAALLNNPNDLRLVATRLQRIIWDSFAEDHARSPIHQPVSMGETRRRFKICEKWFRTMRGDLKFGLLKTLDLLPLALRRELDGQTFEPPATGWTVPMQDSFMTDAERAAVIGATEED